MPIQYTSNSRLLTREQIANPLPRQIYLNAKLKPKTRNTRVSAQGGFRTAPEGVDIDLYAAVQYAIDQGWITVTGDSDLVADAVDNTILANMATQTFKGRTTAGTGNPEDLTKAQAQAILSVDDLITLSGVADGAASLGTFTGTILDDNLTVKAAIQQIETLLTNLSTSTNGANGLSLTPGTNVDSSSSTNGGYTAIGQEGFTRMVATVTPTSAATTTFTLSQASFSPYTPANTVWNINIRQGTTRVAYTLESNTNSALVTFTAANTTAYTVEVLAQSRLV